MSDRKNDVTESNTDATADSSTSSDQSQSEATDSTSEVVIIDAGILDPNSDTEVEAVYEPEVETAIDAKTKSNAEDSAEEITEDLAEIKEVEEITDAEEVDEVEEIEVESDPAKLISEPAKVMRVGSMIKQLLEEVRAADLDEKSRQRLRDIHARSITELESGLAPELRDELERLSLPFSTDEIPSESELRIAQAQLVGWLEGLFHGIQAALVAQQMAARMQLEQMRLGDMKALPPGMAENLPPQLQAVMAEHAARGEDNDSHPGQYL